MRTIRALTSGTLARRVAWIVDSRVRCRIQTLRLRRRHGTHSRELARLRGGRSWHDGTPDRLFAGVDDDFWHWLIRESYFRPEDFEGVLPGFPDEAVQVGYTGSSGELMLWQAFSAYRLLRTLAAEHGRAVPACQGVLDFGCGWGRIIRFFLKDIAADRLWGVDASPEVIEICQRHDRWSRFALVTPAGPTAFSDGAFDLVYSFSVFSHFSEARHFRWLEEIQRILRPGGVLLATTRPRDFIEQSVLDRIRRPLARHPEAIAGMFGDTRRWLAAYDNGRYCYEPLPGMIGWGETCIPPAYVQQHWTKYFTILDYIDDPRRCPQNVIVARR
ncbi:MAG: class I SAM-dependent methyltransferase [Anaerolineales bacterium]